MASPTELALREELALTQNKLQGYADRGVCYILIRLPGLVD